MPEVKGKKYPYTPEGIAAAEEAEGSTFYLKSDIKGKQYKILRTLMEQDEEGKFERYIIEDEEGKEKDEIEKMIHTLNTLTSWVEEMRIEND